MIWNRDALKKFGALCSTGKFVADSPSAMYKKSELGACLSGGWWVSEVWRARNLRHTRTLTLTFSRSPDNGRGNWRGEESERKRNWRGGAGGSILE